MFCLFYLAIKVLRNQSIMHVVTSIEPPVSSHLHPQGGKCVATGGEGWQRWWLEAGGGGVIKTSGRLVQPTVLDRIMCHDMKQKKREVGALRCGWDPGLKQSLVGAVTTKHGKSPVSSLVCLACLSHPFNENGMQCTPHTPFPHCTEPHCVPPCTPPPHSTSKRQTTTTRGEKMNEDE